MRAFADMYRATQFERDGFDYAGETLRAMQHVHFGADRINRIRTYASNTFFLGASPLVRLDRYGNAAWLETGYDLRASLHAALAFLDTPRGRAFAATEPTAAPIARIRANLAALGERIG
ncbi:hypothetical protein Q5424_14650 [Conexibacter sp. JD483]|nr:MULTISPECIES: hypothetical protein [unclassified Conexibacter]MDO8187587.1 hypothetical protein [Conexibacter sp. CPCC 205706]MDO8198953.1 hypothetical protein [Conexibacter sp. CPCC 205762]MDR9370340.1 hypothetical protein [Conexibacter sp. JD483]